MFSDDCHRQRGDARNIQCLFPFAGVDAASQETITKVLHGLRDEGRTVVIVHHDLATVPTLCDWTCLLNRTVMGFGPTKEVFTDEMVKQAYGLATT